MFRPIKVLLVRDFNACNVPYLLYCFYLLKKTPLLSYTEVAINEYLNIDQTIYDVVIYATFPDENALQFNKVRAIIPQTDEKFLSFKGVKLLFDTHSHGNLDGFPRFNNISLPRIKTAPWKQSIEKFNVIFKTTHPIGFFPRSPAYRYVGLFPFAAKNINKNVDISYRVILNEVDNYRSKIRREILKILEPYAKSHSLDTQYKLKDMNYQNYLSQVLISVCPPGHGPGTFRHLETLNAKSLMFSHDSINDIQLLPHADLIEGEDYISFNLENLTNKLDWLLANRKQIQLIAERGHKKFQIGYSVPRSTIRLYKMLRELV